MTLSFHLNSIISRLLSRRKKKKRKIISLIFFCTPQLSSVLKECFHVSPFDYSSLTNFSTVFILFYASSTCKKLHSLEETRYTSMSNHYDRLFSSRHESRVYKKTGNGGKLFECVAREIQVKHREDILMGSEYYFCDNKSPSFSSLSCLRRDIKRRTRFLFFFLVSGSSFSLFDKIEESVV